MSCLKLCLYGIRICGFHARKESITGRRYDIKTQRKARALVLYVISELASLTSRSEPIKSRTSSGPPCLGESPVHHCIPRYVVALVGLDQEVQPDIVEPREEVESVPGALGGRLLSRADLSENISEVRKYFITLIVRSPAAPRGHQGRAWRRGKGWRRW